MKPGAVIGVAAIEEDFAWKQSTVGQTRRGRETRNHPIEIGPASVYAKIDYAVANRLRGDRFALE